MGVTQVVNELFSVLISNCYESTKSMSSADKASVSQKINEMTLSAKEALEIVDVEQSIQAFIDKQYNNIQRQDVLELMMAMNKSMTETQSEKIDFLMQTKERIEKELEANLEFAESGRYLNLIFAASMTFTYLICYLFFKCAIRGNKKAESKPQSPTSDLDIQERVLREEEEALLKKKEKLLLKISKKPKTVDIQKELDEIDEVRRRNTEARTPTADSK